MTMNKLDRRSFLKSSLLTTASLGVFPALGADESAKPKAPVPVASNATGANGDIRFAVVGFGGRGMDHIGELRKVDGARMVALCDVDQTILDRQVKKYRDLGEQIESYTDVRKLLENKDIDVVSFATPNHWHSLGAIWAMQAGKDVYVEKPVSHNVWEGRRVVEVSRQLNRIVQAGTQSRSSRGILEGIQWVREGHIGKILRARGLCYKPRPTIGKVDGPQPIPPGIDYDLWCGPAPMDTLMRKKLHYDWHWVWPTGNGDLGNQGIHQMDLARWALGESALSPRVLSVGGRLGYVDDGTTPNTFIVFHDYPTAPLIFEVRGLPSGAGSKEMDKYRGVSIGVVVDCEGGTMVIPNYSGATILDKDGAEIKKFSGSSSHFANFIDAVRSRKPGDLHAPILEGHLSSALCHTGNISYRLGKTQSPDEMREAVKGNKDLAESLGRMEEHLGANNVDLKQTPATLGAALKMDPLTERFIGSPEADQLLTRDYRKPFVVPAKV
jgi:predicted dehydrogenase